MTKERMDTSSQRRIESVGVVGVVVRREGKEACCDDKRSVETTKAKLGRATDARLSPLGIWNNDDNELTTGEKIKGGGWMGLDGDHGNNAQPLMGHRKG